MDLSTNSVLQVPRRYSGHTARILALEHKSDRLLKKKLRFMAFIRDRCAQMSGETVDPFAAITANHSQ